MNLRWLVALDRETGEWVVVPFVPVPLMPGRRVIGPVVRRFPRGLLAVAGDFARELAATITRPEAFGLELEEKR